MSTLEIRHAGEDGCADVQAAVPRPCGSANAVAHMLPGMPADTRAFEVHESAVRSYCRSFPTVFTRAQGASLYDESGRCFTDLFCGAGALNYGHNPVRLQQALLSYIAGGGITHSLDLYTAAKRQFILDFQSIILQPRDLDYRMMFCGPTGTNAVEAAMKLARKVTGRHRIAAFTNGFHGMSLGALAATGSRFKRTGAGVPLCLVDHHAFDGYFGAGIDTLDGIERLLLDPSSGHDLPAAFLLETVQAEGGINVASRRWVRRLADLARRLDALLIVDDIQAGCGRTGDFFSFDALGIVPDMVCLSKSLSGYGIPMSMLLLKPEIDQWSPGEHNGTFRGNNLAFTTACAALQEWRDAETQRAVRQNCAMLSEALARIAQAHAGRVAVRGRGLIWGLELADGERADRAIAAAFRRGVIFESCGSRGQVLKLLPPINIGAEALASALSVVADVVAEVA